MRVKWLRQALIDLEEIENYVAEDRSVVAINIVLKIIKTASLLEEQCGIGRTGRVPGTKELVVPGLPYIVPYRVKDEVVQVLRVYQYGQKMAKSPLTPTSTLVGFQCVRGIVDGISQGFLDI